MKLAFSIAVRFLKASKGQTLLIVLGIAIGVSVQIFIGSLIQGLQTGLIDKTIGNSPQITIQAKLNTILDYQTLVNQLRLENEDVIQVSATVDGPTLIQDNDETISALIRGMKFEDANGIYNILERIYEGKEPIGINEVLIGRELQEELGIQVDEMITILTNDRKIKELKVTGFYDLKVAALNRSWLLTSISTAQSIFNYDDVATNIELQVSDVFKADDIAARINDQVSGDYIISNWKEQNAELLSGLQGQSISSIMIQVFVLLAVVLGIASVLAITVIQKSRQLGILKAMGIKDSTASLIFLFEGVLLGFAGAIVGVMIGLLLGWSFTKFALNPDGSPVVALTINATFIMLSALIAIASSTFAAMIPAYRSLKLDPIEVIKNG